MTGTRAVLEEFAGGRGSQDIFGDSRVGRDAGRLRARVRLAAIAVWTTALYAAWISGALLTTPSPSQRERWRRWIFRAWARGIARALGMRRVVRGPRPEAPFFLVANHLSYVDVVVLAAELGPTFVAKSEVEDWPGLGFLARSIGTIFVDRRIKRDSLRAIERIDRTVSAGRGVVLFGEGTSTAGETVGPMKPALLEWAARHRYPVRYACLSYRTPDGEPPAHLAVCWWGDMTFLSHLSDLCRLSGFQATLTFGSDSVEADDRARLAEGLRLAMQTLFIPVVTQETI